MNGVAIERVENVKIVGLNIDESLSFSYHIDYVKSRIIPFVAKLAKIRQYLSEQTALMLYYAHIYSHLIFMISIWSVAPKFLTDTLGVIQRRALRIIFRKERLSSNKELFNEKLLPFSSVVLFHQNLTIFKIKHSLFKNHVALPIISETHDFNTRNRNNFLQPSMNSALSQNDFYYRATRSFNNLPENVKKFHSIHIFKNKLKEYLYDSYINE